MLNTEFDINTKIDQYINTQNVLMLIDFLDTFIFFFTILTLPLFFQKKELQTFLQVYDDNHNKHIFREI